MNNWNLNQTFYLKGTTTERRLNRFIEVLEKRCPDGAVVEVASDHLGVNFLDKMPCQDVMKSLKVRGYVFERLLGSMRL